MNHRSTRNYIRAYLPTFCYQTLQEIFTFLKQINKNVSAECLKITISQMCKRGELTSRKSVNMQHPDRGHRYPMEYAKKTSDE
jgi:hypothetical protein